MVFKGVLNMTNSSGSPWNLFIHFTAGQPHRPPFSDAQHGPLTSPVTKNAKRSQTILVPPMCIKVCKTNPACDTQASSPCFLKLRNARYSVLCCLFGTLTWTSANFQGSLAYMSAQFLLCFANCIPRQQQLAIQYILHYASLILPFAQNSKTRRKSVHQPPSTLLPSN